jgi:uncharacterized membrane protein
MRELSGAAVRGTVARWVVDLAVALALAAIALVVLQDSLRVGAGWASDGPEPGFFPLYVAVILLGSALVTAARSLGAASRAQGTFVDRHGLGSVLAVLVPAIAFVAAAAWLGLYVAAAVLIAFFMRWRGGYGVAAGLALGSAIALVLFVTFELWFVTPLPKGPLEQALGF